MNKYYFKSYGLFCCTFQTITSYVMRIRLGGRGYAPGADCALVKHTKGLSEFTDLMHKLQTIVEEELNPGYVSSHCCLLYFSLQLFLF